MAPVTPTHAERGSHRTAEPTVFLQISTVFEPLSGHLQTLLLLLTSGAKNEGMAPVLAPLC